MRTTPNAEILTANLNQNMRILVFYFIRLEKVENYHEVRIFSLLFSLAYGFF